MSPELVKQLAEAFASYGLRDRSAVALEFALLAFAREGVGGTLVIEIPEKFAAPLECRFTTGGVTGNES